jgi:membrane fusion protein (multidrug efflux system)
MMRSVMTAIVANVSLLACGVGAAPAPPPPEVSVVTVAPRSVDEILEFVGEVEASRRVQVRAQVAGVIVDRPFREGAQVRAGDVLYRIERTTYDADWRGARARLADAEARFANARTNADRLQALMADNAVARQDVDNADAELKQARAAVENAEATVDHARKNLDDTVVRAEIAGRVGRAVLDVGTRVTGPGDVLTTIDVLDPIYVSFRPSAQQQLRWRRDPRSSRALAPGGPASVQALFPDGTPFPVAGQIGFVDPVVDPQTGTQQFRAQFTNHDRLLLPGQFVRVRVLGLVRDSAIVVPERAVLQQMGREVVYLVGKGDTVASRQVRATDWSGGLSLIEQGLTAGDRVVVDGVQKAGPGRIVRPVALIDSIGTAKLATGSGHPSDGETIQ